MNIILLGPQGSGKGTQAELLAKKFNLSIFSAGDILRTSTDPKIKSIIDSGNLVPDDVLIQIAKTFIDSHNGIIFDGFPRVESQYDLLKSMVKIDAVVNIEIPESETIKRLSARRTCSKCGEIYNLLTDDKPGADGKCSKCGGELIQREDDKPEAIQKRLQIYREQTHPVFEKAVKEGIGFEVSGDQAIDQVFADICQRLV